MFDAIHFPVSGVDCPWWLPVAVSFAISSLTTSAGVSGAFLLLPFQMSFLHFTSPAVSPTNLIYNIVAIPGGLSRYIKEGRMAWPLAGAIALGTLPGVFVGAVVRIKYLPDPRGFKLFVGLVLLYLGARLIHDLFGRAGKGAEQRAAIERKFQERVTAAKMSGRRVAGLGEDAVVKTRGVSWRRIEYEFWGETFAVSPLAIMGLSLAVGMIGGVYGIGGGVIIAPFAVGVLGLPVYTVAGAALLGTFITSIAGVGYFELLAQTSLGQEAQVRPDYLLGALFGLGGLAGTYVGARLQKYLPERLIRGMMAVMVLLLAIRYVVEFFKG